MKDQRGADKTVVNGDETERSSALLRILLPPAASWVVSRKEPGFSLLQLPPWPM